MILDVGCGWDFKGDVNVDLFLYKNIKNRKKEALHYRNWKRTNKKIPNFITADSAYLPFRDGCFSEVICNHLLEHEGVNWNKTCNEMLRVANGLLTIKVPTPMSMTAYGTFHTRTFTRETFLIHFKNEEITVSYSRYDWTQLGAPIRIINAVLRNGLRVLGITELPCCPVPSEITVSVKKK